MKNVSLRIKQSQIVNHVEIYREPIPPEEISEDLIPCGSLKLFWDDEGTGDYTGIEINGETFFLFEDDLESAIKAIKGRKAIKI